MQEAKKPNAAVVAVIVVVLLASVAGGTFYLMNRKDENGADGTTNDSSQQSETPAASSGSYKNGEYTATGNYLSPGGEESVDVKIVLKDGMVSDATVTPHPASDTSTQYQAEFVNNFKPLVVGKSIDDIQLSRVAGSSLTSGGFNEALEKIKDDAAS